MEPFGIFQFLQSLLGEPAKNEKNEVEEPPVNEDAPPREESPQSPSTDAIVGFLSAHEERARRVRK